MSFSQNDNNNTQNDIPDYIDEISELDLEEPEEIFELSENIDEKSVNSIQILSWKKRYENIPIPSLIVDSSLKVIWFNKSFNEYFNDYISNSNSHLTDYFSSLKDIKKLKVIYNNLNDNSTGYTWKGRVTSKNRKRRSEEANLLITPLDLDENDIPLNFTGVLDIVTDEYRLMLQNMFSSLLRASKSKDNDTGNHIERVNRYSKIVAKYLKEKPEYNEIDEDFIEDIGFLAAMHDVGKIGTPDDILNKKGPLDKWERDIMNEHTKNGAIILSTYPNPMAQRIAIAHHEKWDGTGYPYGINDTMIPLCARIVAIADVYDALRMKRSYKEGFTHKKTKEIIVDLSGTQFDPNIVSCFLEHENEFNEIFSSLDDEKN